jgi:ProP effector
MSTTPEAPAPTPADSPADAADASTTVGASAPAAVEPASQPLATADGQASTPADAALTAEGAESAGEPAAKQAPEQTPAATAARLAELFPALFGGAPKPLKLRIQVDIQERAPGVFSKQALSAFFRRHTGATSYLMAVSKGKQRFDLDGQPAGELSDEHRQVATDELVRRRANVNAKREAEAQQRQLEDQQRYNRANLLRDFETTKLTTPNFCALKGIPVEALDGLLAMARADALEDAQRPRAAEPARREGRHDGRDHRDGRPPRQGAGGGNAGGKAPGQGRRPEGGRPPRRPA